MGLSCSKADAGFQPYAASRPPKASNFDVIKEPKALKRFFDISHRLPLLGPLAALICALVANSAQLCKVPKVKNLQVQVASWKLFRRNALFRVRHYNQDFALLHPFQKKIKPALHLFLPVLLR